MNENVKENAIRAIVCCQAASGDKFALQKQEIILSAFAKKHDYTVTETFVGYGAMSSLVYHSLRLRAKYREFEVLLITELDVLGNGSIEIMHEIGFLNQNGVKVISLKDGELNADTLPLLFRKMFRLVGHNS